MSGRDLTDRIQTWWLKKKLWWRSLSKKQKQQVELVWMLFGIGCFFMLMGVIFIAGVAPLLRMPRDYSDPKMVKAALDLGFLAGIFVVFVSMIVLGLTFWVHSDMNYAYYLEMRLKDLEEWRKEIEKSATHQQ